MCLSVSVYCIFYNVAEKKNKFYKNKYHSCKFYIFFCFCCSKVFIEILANKRNEIKKENI